MTEETLGGAERAATEIPGQRSMFWKPDAPSRLIGRLQAITPTAFPGSDDAGEQLEFNGGVVVAGDRGYRFLTKIVPVTANLRGRVKSTDVGSLVSIEYVDTRERTKIFRVIAGLDAGSVAGYLKRRAITDAYTPPAPQPMDDNAPLVDFSDDDLPF